MIQPKPRVRLPKSISAGEPFTVKSRITHPMHTGLRIDSGGVLVPRHIINRFTVHFDSVPVLSVDLEPAVSADPYIEFEMTAKQSGVLEFTWFDDDGQTFSISKSIDLG